MSSPPTSRSNNAKQEQERRSQNAEQSISATAEESIARDLEDPEVVETLGEDDGDSVSSTALEVPSVERDLARRASQIASGPRPFLGLGLANNVIPTDRERAVAIDEEGGLLRDHSLIPPRRRESEISKSSSKALK